MQELHVLTLGVDRPVGLMHLLHRLDAAMYALHRLDRMSPAAGQSMQILHPRPGIKGG